LWFTCTYIKGIGALRTRHLPQTRVVMMSSCLLHGSHGQVRAELKIVNGVSFMSLSMSKIQKHLVLMEVILHSLVHNKICFSMNEGRTHCFP
jgi:hypothetical protein